jgi:hypothetical protein
LHNPSGAAGIASNLFWPGSAPMGAEIKTAKIAVICNSIELVCECVYKLDSDIIVPASFGPAIHIINVITICARIAPLREMYS